jgi:hypothetical protein
VPTLRENFVNGILRTRKASTQPTDIFIHLYQHHQL